MHKFGKVKSLSFSARQFFFVNSLYEQIIFSPSTDINVEKEKEPIINLAVSEDKKYVAAIESNGKIYVWNIFTRQCVYADSRNLLSEITFLLDSQYFVNCSWNILEIHDFKNKNHVTIYGHFLNTHSEKYIFSKMSLAPLLNNKVAVIRWDGERRMKVGIEILDTTHYKWIKKLEHDNVACIKTISGNRMLSFSYQNIVKLWDLKTFKEIKTIKLPDWYSSDESVSLSISELEANKILFCFSNDEGANCSSCPLIVLDLLDGSTIIGKLPFPKMRDVFEFDHKMLLISEFPKLNEQGRLVFIQVTLKDKSIHFSEITQLITSYGVSAFVKLQGNNFMCGFLSEHCSLFKLNQSIFTQKPDEHEYSDITFNL